MDWTKPIIFTNEFVNRLTTRCILDYYVDLRHCREDIKRKMRDTSVMMPNPKKSGQYWCLIELDKIGLVKIPVVEERRAIVAITIAHPVSNQECIDFYRKNIEKLKFKGE